MTERQQQIPYPLRMPPELRTKLEESATANHRSLAAEIVARLNQSYESAPGGCGEVLQAVLETKALIEQRLPQRE